MRPGQCLYEHAVRKIDCTRGGSRWRWRANSGLERANGEVIGPRELFAMVVAYKLGKDGR